MQQKNLQCLRNWRFSMFGSATWTRTRDPMINSHLLYRLSYRGICAYLTDCLGEVKPPLGKTRSYST
ncbi:protein of unknown function [Pseudomonas sp. JV551A1]|uniref:Uncharacterized protein n=1 Tax=Pseudomonas inefficax TaxID=2078786 RepID=A0AAQ1P9Q3_9PSED|nr:protein of unknown function [Pseudomonas sp. JV551A1]SPO60335.1 protein of unknown function [Pseudomonas inefficax]